MTRILFAAFVLVALAFALDVSASPKMMGGHITSYDATSISVLDKEVVTVGLDEHTTYTKMITRKPWQESTRLDASALAVGLPVYVYVRAGNPHIADWVQITTDMPAQR